jgi:hypothetical protein
MFELKLDLPKNSPVVGVRTTENRGFTPEELAAQCMQQVISVADTAPLGLREQAHAFSKNIEKLVAYYMQQAIRSDRTTVYNALMDAGHPQLADLIRRL